MGYNRFQWWRRGMESEPRPLTGKNHSLLAKIRHGDFDFPYSYIFALGNVDAEIEKVTKQVTAQYNGKSQESLKQDIREATRMKNVRRLKLELEMHDKEMERLEKLRFELKNRFSIDLWDEIETLSLDHVRTAEDLYHYYEKRSKELTPSTL